MFIVRHIITILITIGLIAVGIFMFLGMSWLIYVLMAVLVLGLIYSIRLTTQLKSLSKLVGGKGKNASLTNLLKQTKSKIEEQQEGFRQITHVIDTIGTGNEATQQQFDVTGEVGKALHDLQTKLKNVKQEESIRIWAAQGIAQIGEIRKNNSNMQDYSFQIISQLVKYLDANQGGFYSIEGEEDEQHLELLSAYAYHRRKYTSEKVTIGIGEGLVGQCVLERHMIFMTDVPGDYVKITSGLGAATPRCITIIPLIFREEVFGVIELASFTKFEPYKLEFINKVCEGIALELSGIRTQEKTRLLLEQSQEEELRQSLKEMEAAQHEMLRKEEELSKQLQATKKAMADAELERKKNEAILEGCMDAVISFNENGFIEYFNKAAEEIFGYSRQGILGSPADRILNIHIESGEDGSAIIRSNQGNEVTLRTEINALNSQGEEISLLLTATKVKIEKHYLFTLFAQKVSVDLF